MENALIGISFGGKTLVAGKVKDGRVKKSITRKINNKAPEDEILAEVFNIIHEVKDNEVAGIGIGVPAWSMWKKALSIMSRISPPGARCISKKFLKVILDLKFT